MRARFALLMVITLALVVGCNRTKARLSKPPDIPETANWPALDALSLSREGMERLVRSVSQGHFAATREHLTSDRFRQVATAFAEQPIPEEFATPARQAAKANADKILQQLISDANKARQMPRLRKGRKPSLKH